MATVVNRAAIAPVDKKLASTNRKIAFSPLGVTTPQYTGELILDTSTGTLWFASDNTVTGWTPATFEVG
jgi:hypothetical protein